MKVKTKSIIALMIALFAVMLIGATQVNAVEVTDEVWNSIPNEINVNLKETEHKKANDIVKSQIIEILKGKGITATTEDINVYINNNNIREAEIHIGNKNKKISVVYSNTAEYNKSEQQKVDNIVKGINKNVTATKEFKKGEYIEIYNKTVEKALEPLTKAGYTTTYIGGTGGSGGIFILTGESRFEIYKNEVYYGYIDIEGKVQDKIIIPTTIENTETAMINYATPIIEEYIESLDNDPFYFGSTEYKTGDGVVLKKTNGNYYNVSNKRNKELIATIILERATSNTVSKEDKNTGIKLETTTAVLPSNTILFSEIVKEQTILDKVNKEVLKYGVSKCKVYDINLLKDGAKIQPNGKVKISIPIPNDYNKSKLEVYRIDDNGEIIKYNVTVNGEYASFETDHFSIYVLAEKKEETAPSTPTVNKGEKDETPKTGIQDITYIITAVVIISAIGIIATIKRKQSKH